MTNTFMFKIITSVFQPYSEMPYGWIVIYTITYHGPDCQTAEYQIMAKRWNTKQPSKLAVK